MDTLKQLNVAFICPHLEYATTVWDPHLSKDTQELKSVQRFACRVCTKSWDDVYCDMLHTMNIPPSPKGGNYQNCVTFTKLFMGLLTFLMHHYCTSLALIALQDTHILSHSYNLRLAQTLTTFPFFHSL